MKLLYLKLSKVISSMWLSQVKVTLDYTFLPWNFKYGNTIFTSMEGDYMIHKSRKYYLWNLFPKVKIS